MRGHDARKIREAVETRRKELDKKRESGGWMSHWRLLSQYGEPRSGHWLYDSRTTKGSDKWHDDIINEELGLSTRTLMAGMQTNMTNPYRPWVDVGTSDPDLNENHEVKQWLKLFQLRLLDLLFRSNCYETWYTGHGDAALFGTIAEATILNDPRHFIRMRSLPIGSFWCANNELGRVDVVYEKFKMSKAQMITAYGEDNVSSVVKSADIDKEFDIIQAIEPNDERMDGMMGWRGMRYRSVHYEEKGNDDHLLRVGGFNEFPIEVSRWQARGTTEAYGNSPAMYVLGSTRQLQANEMDSARIIEKMGDPPTGVPKQFLNQRGHDGGLMPGELIPIDELAAGTGSRIGSLYDAPNTIGAIEEKGRMIAERIRRGMYADVFMMMSMERVPEQRELQVIEKKEEKLQELGPVIDRMHNERYTPQIEKSANKMFRLGLVPPIPRQMMGMPIRIQYKSTMAQAMRALGIGNFDRLLNITTMAMELDPSARHRVDIPEFVERYAEKLDVDPTVIRSDEEVERLSRQDRQAAAAQQGAETAATGTQALSNMAAADPGAAQRMAQGMVPQ